MLQRASDAAHHPEKNGTLLQQQHRHIREHAPLQLFWATNLTPGSVGPRSPIHRGLPRHFSSIGTIQVSLHINVRALIPR